MTTVDLTTSLSTADLCKELGIKDAELRKAARLLGVEPHKFQHTLIWTADVVEILRAHHKGLCVHCGKQPWKPDAPAAEGGE